MSIPNVEEGRILQNYVRNLVSLRLFSNDVTPSEADTLATYTEVIGGGYVAKSLLTASWVLVAGGPSTLTYALQTFAFTGITNGPGTIYGYYLVDTHTELYIGGERFPGSIVPFNPVAGSTIRITPKVLGS